MAGGLPEMEMGKVRIARYKYRSPGSPIPPRVVDLAIPEKVQFVYIHILRDKKKWAMSRLQIRRRLETPRAMESLYTSPLRLFAPDEEDLSMI